MKISILQFKRLLKEAMSDQATHHKLLDGFSKQIQPTVQMCTDQILSEMADIASKFESHPEYGIYVSEFDFRDNADLQERLAAGISKLIDDLADELIESAIARVENEASYGNSYQSNVFDKARKARQNYRAARNRVA